MVTTPKSWIWNPTKTGDWFTNSWQDTVSHSAGQPAAGDTAIIIGGTVTVTGTDAVVDGVTLDIGLNTSQPGATPPVLQSINGAFGSGFVMLNAENSGTATFSALGATKFGGQLEAAYSGVPLGVNIGLYGGVGVLTNTGTFSALYTGSILDIAAAPGTSLVNASGGIITAGAFGTVDFTGTAGVSLTNASGGTITAAPGGTIDIKSGVANYGKIVANSAGTVMVTGSVVGTGTITDAGVVKITGNVASSQTIDMSAGTGDLMLGEPIDFHGTIIGFGGSDLIDLVNTAADSATVSSGVLAVMNKGATVASFNFTGTTPLYTFSDGNGGTFISREQLGTPDQVVTFMTALNSDASPAAMSFWGWNDDAANPQYSLSNGNAHDWGAGATITYSFGSAAGAPAFTSTEMGVLQLAMVMWSDVANVHFQQVASGAELTIDRSLDGAAQGGASYPPNGSLSTSTSGTLTIDTSKFPLDGFATDGYGITTALHELGHVLGLGHPGPYNEGNGTPQAIFYTDTRQYSVMSYFPAAAPTNDTLTKAGFTTTYAPTTPGLYDIEAIERLYGPSKASALAGGQVFGFNSNTGIASFDFTQNTNPVVTLFDLGANNTLDLSVFTSTSIVDLMPGTFSSADGMTNNIGIYYNTAIDKLVGSSGGNTVTVNNDSDVIIGSASASDTVIFAGKFGDYSFAKASGVLSVTGHGVTDQLTNIETMQFADMTVATSAVACYARGTHILTLTGDVPVEDLAIGDMVVTVSGAARPIKWIGRRAYGGRFIAGNRDVLPIRVARDAIVKGVPARDLWVSPEHSLYIDDVLVQAKHLLNGITVVQAESVPEIEYFHVELEGHDVIYADGAPAETFVDCDNRLMFVNGAEYDRLYPEDERPRWQFCAPRLEWGSRGLLKIREWMFERAHAAGFTVPFDPEFHLVVDGIVVRPQTVNGALYRFELPAGAKSVSLHSCTHVPAETDPTSLDTRRLGVPVARISVYGGDASVEARHANPILRDGFHEAEASHRWTDGAAELPAELLNLLRGPAALLVQLAPAADAAVRRKNVKGQKPTRASAASNLRAA